MNLTKEITLTPTGGRFYRAMIFHYAFLSVALPPVLLILLLAVVNPFWFRDSFFVWVENTLAKIGKWRNYQKYRIYLGCDPKIWHTLRGDL